MELTFSPAAPSDGADIFRFARELIETYEDPREMDLDRALKWTRRKIETHIDEYRCVYCGGQKAGFFRFVPCEGGMELDDLYILPEYRGRGIGTAVVERCCAETALPVMLYVFIQNTGALGLYQRLGFTITEQVSATRCILRREAP